MKDAGRIGVRGALATGSAQALKVVVSILSVVVLSRVLSPSDFGVIAMMEPIAGFVLIFQNLGLNAAAIQARTLSAEQRSALFAYNMLASLAIAVLFLAGAPAIAWFYGDSRPGYVLAASVLNVLIGGAAMQHMAQLNRELRFVVLAKIDVVGTILVFLVTLGAALWLRSYWAIWLGSLAGIVWSSLAAWTVERWRPSLKFAWSSASGLVKFGLNVTSANLLSFLVRNADNVMIAKVYGAAPLGLYDRAYRLMMFPLQRINQPLSTIFVPLLARLIDEPERYRRVYLRVIRTLSLAIIPGIAAAAATSEPLVALLLGERWSGTAAIFTWLAIAVAVQPITATNAWLFLTTNRPREMLRWTMLGAPISLTAFVAGLPWGPAGVAAGYAIAEIIKTPILIRRFTHTTPVAMRDVYHVLLPSIFGGGFAWVISYLVDFARMGAPACIAATFVLSYALSFAFHAATRVGRDEIVGGFRQIKQALGRPKP